MARATSEPRHCMRYGEFDLRLHPADIVNLDIILIENFRQSTPPDTLDSS